MRKTAGKRDVRFCTTGVFMLNDGTKERSLVVSSSGDGTPQNPAWQSVDGLVRYKSFAYLLRGVYIYVYMYIYVCCVCVCVCDLSFKLPLYVDRFMTDSLGGAGTATTLCCKATCLPRRSNRRQRLLIRPRGTGMACLRAATATTPCGWAPQLQV